MRVKPGNLRSDASHVQCLNAIEPLMMSMVARFTDSVASARATANKELRPLHQEVVQALQPEGHPCHVAGKPALQTCQRNGPAAASSLARLRCRAGLPHQHGMFTSHFSHASSSFVCVSLYGSEYQCFTKQSDRRHKPSFKSYVESLFCIYFPLAA